MKKKKRYPFRLPRRVNRKYKDRLFRFVFSDKKDLLSLYNAVNQTAYDDPEELEFNTLEDVIYLSMKNDLSFVIGSSMNLYEHQSTWNKNMPLRGLLYFAELYQGYVNKHGYRLTGSGRIPLPCPNYLVFYNGLEEERTEQFLSDAFEGHTSGDAPCLECRATMLNINKGHNPELMKKCRRLWEYAEFIDEIRQNLGKGQVLEDAVERAIRACRERGILADILSRNQTEVRKMLLEEYDEKAEREYLRKESIEMGLREGMEKGLEQGLKQGLEQGRRQGECRKLVWQTLRKLQKGKSPETIAEELEEDVDQIREICRSAEICGTETDCDQVCRQMEMDQKI